MVISRKLQRLTPVRHKVIVPEKVLDLGQYVRFPPGYRPTNPSIVGYGPGYLVCVRGVAYTISEALRVHDNSERLPSLNRCFLLNADLTFQRAIPLPPRRLDRLEDLKLFTDGDRVWAVGSMPVINSPHANACVVTLVEFNAGLDDCRIVPLASPLGLPLEKNWAPFLVGGVPHFLYSCDPLLVLRYEPAAAAVTFAPSPPSGFGSPQFLEGGSSGGIATTTGTLFLTHRRVVRLPSRRRIYFSRIRFMRRDLRDFTAGPFFSIGRPTVQFANGLQVDAQRVIITYGEMDATAWLGCFSLIRFEQDVFPAGLRFVPLASREVDPVRMAL